MAIEVTYRRTRRLSMRIVQNGDVHVSAPVGMPRSVIERFIDEHRDWMAAAQQRVIARQQQRAAFYGQLPLQTARQRTDAVQRLSAVIAPMVAQHAARMGVTPRSVTYRRMISRWGVCRVRESALCFSLYLLLLPEWCIEHVVVHELCHLLEPSHNARFHQLMDRYYPRWREARRVTRRITSSSDSATSI